MLLDLFTEPDIFNIKWDALTQYNGIIYPALPDLYGPTMNVSSPPLLAIIHALFGLCDLLIPSSQGLHIFRAHLQRSCP